MKELIKPKRQVTRQLISLLCEVDCGCPHVICNKDCEGAGKPNSSSLEEEDILF